MRQIQVFIFEKMPRYVTVVLDCMAETEMITREQEEEIARTRGIENSTRRATVPAMEEILYTPFKVLDHGFVRVIDYMGSDEAIVQAARVSYGKGTQKTQTDRGLIRYLMRHRHTTPFEMCEVKLHVKLPIFVARQWVRHRTANINEYSGRYSIMDHEFYLPGKAQIAAQSKTNRQGRGDTVGDEEVYNILARIASGSSNAYAEYEKLLNEDKDGKVLNAELEGLARELARMVLPTNFYTQWYWKIDLHNLFHFLSLRTDSHAQYEIRVYADIILHEIVKQWTPFAYGAFIDYRLNGAYFSAEELVLIQKMLAGQAAERTVKPADMSSREWNEFLEKLKRVHVSDNDK